MNPLAGDGRGGLAACPFCGGEAHVRDDFQYGQDGGGYCYAVCQQCGARSASSLDESRKVTDASRASAAAAWNRRAALSAELARREVGEAEIALGYLEAAGYCTTEEVAHALEVAGNPEHPLHPAAAGCLPVCGGDAWAVIRPEGMVELVSIRASEHAAQWAIGEWNKMEPQGFRCIRIRIATAATPAPVGPTAEGLDFEPDEQHTVADMANVGYALMQAIEREMPGYCYNDSPSEIVSDLINERDEARAAAPVGPGMVVVPKLDDEEMAALVRFAETSEDDESYDVPGEMMNVLHMRGVIKRGNRRGWYYLTDFGRAMLAAATPPGEEA